MNIKIICRKIEGNPKPRLTRDGYTKMSGSPTHLKVVLEGEKTWRRVYARCFSNAPVHFVKRKGETIYVTL